MNCIDCASLGQHTAAVGICTDCGAGICGDHARLSSHWLTWTAALNRVVSVDSPGRLVRCPVCRSAHDAAPPGLTRHAG